jgi:phospholipase C
VEAVQANPNLWNETAILITFDEGGGYYDSLERSRTTIRITFPFSSSSRGTGISILYQAEAGTISPTQW